MLNPFKKYQNIHCIGIGGIGLSALAMLLKNYGHTLSGSDQSTSIITEKLISAGIKVSTPHSAENIPDNTDLIIFSSAIPEDNIELLEGKRREIKRMNYPQAVGKLTENFKTIAICGTHGKTTTTALTGLMLTQNQLDPTVIVGALIPDFTNQNYRIGNSEHFVLEACEYERAFLNYKPQIIILTNIELDHLDYYQNLDDYINAFQESIGKLPSDGFLIANIDDQNIQKILRSLSTTKIITYGKSPLADFQIKENAIYKKGELYTQLDLKIPGEHNLYNACAALSLNAIFPLDKEKSRSALENYRGSSRRFEIKGKMGNATLIDDYAHHPTEIKATLKAAREKFGPQAKILCIFQPHQYSRTIELFEEFTKAFDHSDKVIISKIYEARDKKEDLTKVSSEKLAERINVTHPGKALDGGDLQTTAEKAKNLMENFDVIITMGAGDIYKVANSLLK